MKITFLLANAYGMGGTIRSTVNLATALAKSHDVELVTLAQNRTEPFFEIGPDVKLRTLAYSYFWPERPEQSAETAELERHPAQHVPDSEARHVPTVFNAAVERAVQAFLSSVQTDVVVSTRPGLNSWLARSGAGRYVRIGQEHLSLGQQPDDVQRHIRDVHTDLDLMTVLTDADRRAYARFLGRPETDPWLLTMPNAIPDVLYPRARLDNPIIAAAGRLIPVKQYPKLVRAFAVVAEKHPDWQLRIYGKGKEKARIRSAITEMGVNDQVVLMGPTSQTPAEFAKAAMTVCSSEREGLSMTIAESFAVGVPVVSFDCPHGPRELIDDGRCGLLVDDQDIDALARGMLRLVEDEDERRSMGAAALEQAQEYRPATIVARWEEKLSALRAEKRRRTGLRRFLPW